MFMIRSVYYFTVSNSIVITACIDLFRHGNVFYFIYRVDSNSQTWYFLLMSYKDFILTAYQICQDLYAVTRRRILRVSYMVESCLYDDLSLASRSLLQTGEPI